MKPIYIKVNDEDKLVTPNLAKGIKVYGEKLVEKNGIEYRIWDPYRSKLAAAILKGLEEIPIKEGSKVLYLGASTGTTSSHVSDLIGKEGIIFAVEVSPRVAREFLERVAKYRKNVVPILQDARKPQEYGTIFGKVDLVYCDVAQPDQTDIAILNCKLYLRNNGYLLLVIKARSIDVVKEPKEVYKEEVDRLEKNGFKVVKLINLEPFDKDHAMILAKFHQE
jgi:fibrillarin-like pre-rRNA processing protein